MSETAEAITCTKPFWITLATIPSLKVWPETCVHGEPLLWLDREREILACVLCGRTFESEDTHE